MTLVQARVSHSDAERLDADARALGLPNRSEAIREGLRLLHRRAQRAALAREYDDFYAVAGAPISDIAAIGDLVAADTLSPDRARR